MKKKLSTLVAAVMILSMGITAFADHAQPRTPTCIECGGDTYRVSEETEYPLAPQRCEKCGVKTSAGTLKILSYVCTSCKAYTEISHFICFDCQ